MPHFALLHIQCAIFAVHPSHCPAPPRHSHYPSSNSIKPPSVSLFPRQVLDLCKLFLNVHLASQCVDRSVLCRSSPFPSPSCVESANSRPIYRRAGFFASRICSSGVDPGGIAAASRHSISGAFRVFDHRILIRRIIIF